MPYHFADTSPPPAKFASSGKAAAAGTIATEESDEIASRKIDPAVSGTAASGRSTAGSGAASPSVGDLVFNM